MENRSSIVFFTQDFPPRQGGIELGIWAMLLACSTELEEEWIVGVQIVKGGYGEGDSRERSRAKGLAGVARAAERPDQGDGSGKASSGGTTSSTRQPSSVRSSP
jgi:hypothetical protein